MFSRKSERERNENLKSLMVMISEAYQNNGFMRGIHQGTDLQGRPIFHRYPNPGTFDIFSVIRMFCEKIMLERSQEVIINPRKVSLERYTASSISNVFFLNWDTQPKLYGEVKALETREDIAIYLGHDPVINLVRKQDSLQEQLILKLVTPEEPWKVNFSGEVMLIMPIGVTFFTGGIHSAFVGAYKRDGVIHIRQGEQHGRYNAIDISDMYNYIYFDGTYYRFIYDDSKAALATNYDFGCIFEIGRHFYELDISFNGIPPCQHSAEY